MSAEMPSVGTPPHKNPLTSTGPRSDERGNSISLPHDAQLPKTSTGPRSDERGNLVLVGRLVPLGNTSTGPRSDERGNAVADLKHKFSAFRLQRGRAQMSAEISSSSSFWRRSWLLQRGRAQMSAEIPRCVQDTASLLELQRGRAQMSAEILWRSARQKPS